MYAITVIGGGISALSLLTTLNKEGFFKKNSNILVKVVAPYGLGYSPNFFNQTQTTLCNTSVGVNSIIYDDPNHYLNWLVRKGFKYNKEDFLERAFYGRYLYDVSVSLQKELNKEKKIISVIHDSFLNSSIDENKIFITLASGKIISTDILIFCAGHVERESRKRNYFYYPEDQNRIQEIEENNPLKALVIGTRLSAIDVSLLIRDKKNIKFDFSSLSGQFPAIRHELLRYDSKFLTKSNVMKYAKKFNVGVYKAFIAMIKKEVRSCCKVSLNNHFKNGFEQLEQDIKNAQKDYLISWQKKLDNIMFLLNSVWPFFTDDERNDFMFKHGNMVKRYLYSFPEKNATQVLSMYKEGRVQVFSERINVLSIYDKIDDNGIEINGRHYDVVIDASGCIKQCLYMTNDGKICMEKTAMKLQFLPGQASPIGMEDKVYVLGSMRYYLPVVNYINEIAFHAKQISQHLSNNFRLANISNIRIRSLSKQDNQIITQTALDFANTFMPNSLNKLGIADSL